LLRLQSLCFSKNFFDLNAGIAAKGVVSQVDTDGLLFEVGESPREIGVN
jgi:hypothetical protein